MNGYDGDFDAKYGFDCVCLKFMGQSFRRFSGAAVLAPPPR
jgi:hypothetical protein